MQREHHRTAAARAVSVVVCAALIGGCANPVARWKGPDDNVKGPTYSIDYGIAYAHSARKAYEDHIDQQSALSTNVSTGLIGLGGIIAALATFGAHKDAIIGTALFGGTAYALANWNYNKQRQLVYQAG